MVGDIQAAGQGHWSAVLASHHVEPANKIASDNVNKPMPKKKSCGAQRF